MMTSKGGLHNRGDPRRAVTPPMHSPFHLALGGLGQYGRCMVPYVLPVLISSALNSPGVSTLCKDFCRWGRIVPTAAPLPQLICTTGGV